MRYLLLILSTALLFNCGPKSEPEQVLTGPVEYRLHSLAGYDTLLSDAVNIIITDTSFTGQGPVNRYFGQIAAGRIGPVGSTMMAGDQALMDFEHKYFASMDAGNIEGVGSDTMKILQDSEAVIVYLKK